MKNYLKIALLCAVVFLIIALLWFCHREEKLRTFPVTQIPNTNVSATQKTPEPQTGAQRINVNIAASTTITPPQQPQVGSGGGPGCPGRKIARVGRK